LKGCFANQPHLLEGHGPADHQRHEMEVGVASKSEGQGVRQSESTRMETW
jgi:hypothetical protein